MLSPIISLCHTYSYLRAMQFDKEIGSYVAAICRALCRDSDYNDFLSCVKRCREETTEFLKNLHKKLKEKKIFEIVARL